MPINQLEMPKKQNGNFVIDIKRREIDFCMLAN